MDPPKIWSPAAQKRANTTFEHLQHACAHGQQAHVHMLRPRETRIKGGASSGKLGGDRAYLLKMRSLSPGGLMEVQDRPRYPPVRAGCGCRANSAISRTCSKISCRAHEVTGTHHMLRTIPIIILSDLANTELGYNCHIGRMHALKGPHTLRLHPEESRSVALLPPVFKMNTKNTVLTLLPTHWMTSPKDDPGGNGNVTSIPSCPDLETLTSAH